ncbi:hypothetical protein [Halobacillus campisalis]|uniref:hypothetical protein n=1 Tax=Halobacillus campisalis TaxID=435909 RepID=UPI0036F1CE17
MGGFRNGRDSCGKRVIGETPQDEPSEEAHRTPTESESIPKTASTQLDDGKAGSRNNALL